METWIQKIYLNQSIGVDFRIEKCSILVSQKLEKEFNNLTKKSSCYWSDKNIVYGDIENRFDETKKIDKLYQKTKDHENSIQQQKSGQGYKNT